MAVRTRSSLLSVLVLAALVGLAARGVPFVSAPGASAASLRGQSGAAAAAAVAVSAPGAVFAADELIEYPMAGEITVTNIIYFFVITLGGTAFAFASYFALTKLKII
mmetsp:Transcript_47480/g.112888  ORF Transcript_47480/g.112888 Transcript_47480/m.112888 type:complete len:107 (+) Transcript_47480:86-406(+)